MGHVTFYFILFYFFEGKCRVEDGPQLHLQLSLILRMWNKLPVLPVDAGTKQGV